ncbi:TetR/AcrR family transcriptional regulator [Agromyces larvae]|uniref:TetR/AcrR family transcriptional regulator n=1 Tax=Agromyces larvae TaxID=2929802 RepID=A0ABY4BXX0_9MICO|nr:TetR/AcrR family transcriptional regulator [Agromyces larvae]UOE42521.1 TetR/AcrR family transcriptional regulator [Agromyces larvae]
MPKVSEAYRTARRDEIIDAALRCFAEHGYSRTAMSDVIAESGLSAGAIYGHFAGKKELFIASAGKVLEARLGELDERRAGGEPLPPAEVLATLIEGMRRERFTHMIPQLWGEAAIDPEIRAVVQPVLERLRATVRDHAAAWAQANPDRVEGDPAAWAERMAPVMLGIAPGFMVQRTVLEQFDEEGYLAALRELLPH